MTSSFIFIRIRATYLKLSDRNKDELGVKIPVGLKAIMPLGG